MRAIICLLAALTVTTAWADQDDLMPRTYKSYEDYERAMDREADRDYARYQAREQLKLQREEVEAQQQTAHELHEMRQNQYWRDVEDRMERDKRRQFDMFP